MRPLQAHCHLGLGTLYVQTGRPEPARAALTAAIALYRAMEMTFWLPQAEAALAQVMMGHGETMQVHRRTCTLMVRLMPHARERCKSAVQRRGDQHCRHEMGERQCHIDLVLQTYLETLTYALHAQIRG